MHLGQRGRILLSAGMTLVLASLFLRPSRGDEPPDFSRWEKAIVAFEQQDKDNGSRHKDLRLGQRREGSPGSITFRIVTLPR